MATYAIGDLQGCAAEFDLLLDKIGFGAKDELWLVGDLINRGPDSLAVMRRVMAMGEQCKVVLGNHDLHFLAIYFGGHRPGRSDTYDELLSTHDVEDVAHWLRRCRMLHRDAGKGYVMTHAGLPHIWNIEQAEALAQEVETVLAGDHPQLSYRDFFVDMYGNKPARWDADLAGMPRYRSITNYLTRMRLIADNGTLDFDHKGALSEAPAGWRPWFELVDSTVYPEKVLFGHWAALDGETRNNHTIGLDTGCVWGRELTALHLETGVKTAVKALSG